MIQSLLSPHYFRMRGCFFEGFISNMLWGRYSQVVCGCHHLRQQRTAYRPSYQKKRFSTFNSDLKRFASWLLENNCLDLCESTGKYWVPVFPHISFVTKFFSVSGLDFCALRRCPSHPGIFHTIPPHLYAKKVWNFLPEHLQYC